MNRIAMFNAMVSTTVVGITGMSLSNSTKGYQVHVSGLIQSIAIEDGSGYKFIVIMVDRYLIHWKLFVKTNS